MKKLLFINSFSGVLQVCINSVLLFITIPIFIRLLGIEQYGLFSLIFVIGGIGAIASFGFNTSLLKYLSEQGITRESNYDIVATLLVICCFVIPGAVIANYFSDAILSSLFRIEASHINSNVKELFMYALWSNVFLIIGQIPTAIIDSLQKIYITNLLQAVYNFTTRLLMLLVLLTNPTLSLIGLSIFISTVLWFVLLVYITVKQWGGFEIAGLVINFRRVIKKHISYGYKVFTTSMLGLLYEPLTKIMINVYLGLHAVAFFEIALRLKGFIWSIGERLLYPIAPMLASMKDSDQIKRYLAKVEQTSFIFSGPLIVMVLFSIHDVLFFWLGESNNLLAWSAALIIISYIIALVLMPTYFFLMIRNKPHKALFLQFCNVVVNAILFFLLVPSFGYWGAVIAYSAAVIVTFAISIYYNIQYFGSTFIFAIENKRNLLLLLLLLAMINSLLMIISVPVVAHIGLLLVLNGSVTFIAFQRLGILRDLKINDLRNIFSNRV